MRQPKQTERGFLIFYAKVLLRESAARRGDRQGFDHALLNWACDAYREAVATPRHQAFQRVSHQPKPRLDTLPLFASTAT